MSEWQCWLADEAATVALGRQLGRALAGVDGCVSVHLEGDLGAGKTTLTRGVLQCFGHSGPVKSPTYTLVEVYALAERPVYHFDLYRLGDAEELEYMGIRDYFASSGICLIEWPTRGAGILPTADIRLALGVQAGGRLAKLSAGSRAGDTILQCLARQDED